MANSRQGMETKAITEGAFMSALAVLLVVVGVFVPILALITNLVWALPIVVLCMRHGMRAGVAAMAVVGVLLMLLITPLRAIQMMISLAAPALVLGCGLLRKWSTEKILALTGFATFLGMCAYFVLTIQLMGLTLQQFMGSDPESIRQVVRLYEDLGFLATVGLTAYQLEEYVTMMMSALVIILPSALLISGLGVALLNYAVANMILKRLKVELPPVTRLATFRLPMGIVFVFIAGLAMIVMGGMFFEENATIPVVGQNILLVVVALYFFQGYALVAFLLERYAPASHKFLRIVFAVLMLVNIIVMFVPVALAGLIDALFDPRKLEYNIGADVDAEGVGGKGKNIDKDDKDDKDDKVE